MCKKRIIMLLIAFLLSLSSIVLAQNTERPLTNADVVTMVKAGLPDSTIVLAIQQGAANFDTSPTALIELKNQGASSKILDAVLQAQAKTSKKSESVVVTPVKIPVQTLEYKLFTFEIKQCTLLGKRLTCEILVTNNDRDKELRIYYDNNAESTRVINVSGNEYKANKVQFGSDERDPNMTLVTGIPVKLTLIFDDLPQTTSNLTLLEIFASFEKKEYTETTSAQFRNVPVTITTPPSDSKTLRVYEKEFSFELKSCRKVGNVVVCSVEVKNNGPKEASLILMVSCGGSDRSRIIDESGTEYRSTEGSIGEETISSGGFGRCYAKGEIAARGVISMIIKFDNAADVNLIKLLRIRTGYSYDDDNFDIDFRDVSVTTSK